MVINEISHTSDDEQPDNDDEGDDSPLVATTLLVNQIVGRDLRRRRCALWSRGSSREVYSTVHTLLSAHRNEVSTLRARAQSR